MKSNDPFDENRVKLSITRSFEVRLYKSIQKTSVDLEAEAETGQPFDDGLSVSTEGTPDEQREILYTC